MHRTISVDSVPLRTYQSAVSKRLPLVFRKPILLPDDSDDDLNAVEIPTHDRPLDPDVSFTISLRLPPRDVKDPRWSEHWRYVLGYRGFRQLLKEMREDGDELPPPQPRKKALR